MTQTTQDANPRGMLTLFRQNMEGYDAEQVRLFNLLPAAEKMELLFHMIVNNNKILQQLHHMIKPDKAYTQGMPEPENVN